MSYGSILGDIAGSTREFSNNKSTNSPLFPPGSNWTDDSVLTHQEPLFVGADTLGNSLGEYDIVWLDMDGVLADFLEGAKRHTGRSHLAHAEFEDYNVFPKLGTTCDEFFAGVGEDFWATLPPCPEFGRVVEMARHRGKEVGIASMPPPLRAAECIMGKRRWLAQHLPWVKHIRFTHEKHLLAKAGTLLIDDLPGNIETFRAHGGTGWLLARPWNTRHHSVMAA